MKRALLLFGGLVLLALLALATPSQALQGDCSGTIEEKGSFDPYFLPDEGEYTFREGVDYTYRFNALFTIREYGIVVMGPTGEISAVKGESNMTSDGSATFVSGNFSLSQLEGIAVGKYLIHITVGGERDYEQCRGTLTATIEGNPLTTLVGGASAVAVAGGSAGAVAAFIKLLALKGV